MGDVADMMLDGTLCEGCGVYIESESDGVPRTCSQCIKEARKGRYGNRVKCPHCPKMVKKGGLDMHIRDVHGKNST